MAIFRNNALSNVVFFAVIVVVVSVENNPQAAPKREASREIGKVQVAN